MVFNQDQGEVKDSLNRIMSNVKEVNQDGREIKDSQIQISEESIKMNNTLEHSVLKQFLQ